MKNGLKILDMRCRPPFKSFLNEGYPFGLYNKFVAAKLTIELQGAAKLARTIDEPTMEAHMEEMDKAGVDIAVAAYRAAWGDPINNRPPVDNEELLELVEKYPGRFIGVPCVSPIYHTQEQIAAMTEKLIVKGPLRGFAMEPIIDRPNWFVNDKRAMAVYEVASQYNIPVMFTYSSMPFEDVAALKEAATTFKNVNFVLCHGGAPRVFEVIDLAFGLGNIYISPDGNLVNTAYSRPFIDGANYMIRERFLFGSSQPLGSMEHAVHYYLTCGLREEVLPDIMFNNAARLFGIA